MKKKELSKMTYADMVKTRDKLRRQLLDLRMEKVLGHVDNPLALRTIKRDIACLNTLIHAQDIGIAAKVTK